MNKENQFIAPPMEYLASFEDWPEGTLSMGNWIWSREYTRSYFRHTFKVDCAEKRLQRAELEFQSDGAIDLYFNEALMKTVCERGRYRTGVVDITAIMKEGDNRISIRSFTSDNPLQFHVALRGCIRLYYKDGSTEDVRTGAEWQKYHMSQFWKSEETQDWMNTDAPGRLKTVEAGPVHPRLLKRACLFRKAFSCKKPIQSAVLTSSALGLYVPYLNGKRITEDRYIPGSMELAAEYQVYEVTGYLREGANMIGAETGNGWYNCESWGNLKSNIPALMMELRIKYGDGTVECIATDPSWQVQASPRLENDIQYGERYDAGSEIPGWNVPEDMRNGAAVSGSDTVFNECAVYADLSQRKPFVRQSYPAVRIQREEEAIAMGTFQDGSVYYKFSNNSTGRAKLCLKNTKPGEMVLIRYCEVLTDGEPYTETYGDVFYPEDTCASGRAPYGVRNLDVYLCKGAEEECYLPEFAYTGFQYVYLKGYSGDCTLETVKKVEMNTNLAEVGEFQCSDSELNRIWDAVKRSYRSNAFTGPMDCPTREKNFWNGDIQIFAATACWYMDNKDFLSAWTRYGRKMQPDVYGWEDEEYILPLILYRYYGDKQILEDKYPVVQKLMKKRRAQLKLGEMLPTDHAPYGDHQAIVNVPGDFFAACYYCLMYRDMSEIAEILDKAEDAAAYQQEFEKLKSSFNEKYYLPEEKEYSPRCQSGIVLPVAFGIAPEADLEKLAANLHRYVVDNEYHLTTGFMATEHVLNILCEYGYRDAAWRIMTNQEYPSLIYMIRSANCGTTTENWMGYDPRYGCSMNHYAIGGSAKYFFEQLGGIRIVKPGFDEVRLCPDFRKELKECQVRYRTRHGEIVSHWHYDEEADCFEWSVNVPEGVKAKYYAPENVRIFKEQRDRR